MKTTTTICLLATAILILISCKKEEITTEHVLINHNCTDMLKIPVHWINKAKTDLHIAFGHTARGSQIINGMSGLEEWKGEPYQWNDGVLEGQLDIDDKFVPGDLAYPDRTSWETNTRTYLAENKDVNVVIWAWCAQVGISSEENIKSYLELMQGLEEDFPEIKFVYMTGNTDGTGASGNLHLRNEQIRLFCRENNKILYDFADIESFDPDGINYFAKLSNEAGIYDSNENGLIDGMDENWATKWQSTHNENIDWYNCNAPYSQPIIANMKTYAAWWLWARLAGWDGK